MRTAIVLMMLAACDTEPPPCADALEAYYETGCMLPWRGSNEIFLSENNARAICEADEHPTASAVCQDLARSLRECLVTQDSGESCACGEISDQLVECT